MEFNIKFYFLWLSLLCVVVFVLQQVPGFTEMFVLNNKALYEYQYWRFLTAVFLHGSITHLAYNMFALLFFGIILEKTIDSNRFLGVFLVSGVVANIVSVNFYSSSLGASGGIYGILGAIVILNPMMMVWAFGLIMPMFVAAILWIAGDILGAIGVFEGNTGYIAHLVGAGVGLVAGFIFRSMRHQFKKKEKFNISDAYVSGWEKTYMK